VICAQCLLAEVPAASADVAENRSIQTKSNRTRRTGKAEVSCPVVVLAAKVRVDLVVSAVARPVVAAVLPGASRRERETCPEDVRNLRWC
jgi:hypothetical protein